MSEAQIVTEFVDPDDDEVIPFDVEEPIEVGDLSDQEGGVLEAATKVPFVIKKASVRTQLQDNRAPASEGNKWKVKKLALQVAVGPLGTDGEGRYAGKVLFPELILTMNAKEFPDDFKSPYWQREARFPIKQFLLAIGHDIKALTVNDEWLTGLVGMEFIADIKRSQKRSKGADGKYHPIDEFENKVENFRAGASVSEEPEE
jgi:hypothetical protein